jgi:drug/metabolite transporter (DMT)-like permease
VKSASWVRFLILASMWGCSFAFIKVALGAFAPNQVALGRLAVGALVISGVLVLRGGSAPPRRVWGHIAVASLFGNAMPFVLFALGEQYTTASIAGVIQGVTPLVTLGLATLAVSAERATVQKTVGLVIGFLGLVGVVGPWNAEGFGSVAGQLLCVGAAASYAVSFVYVRRFIAPHKVPALAVTAGQLSSATVLMGVATAFTSGFAVSGRVSVGPVLALLALGAVSTGTAFVLLNRLIADEGATMASAVNYLVPVFSVIVGAVFLGESVTWNVPVGGAVVILGLALAEGRLTTVLRKRQEVRDLPLGQKEAQQS